MQVTRFKALLFVFLATIVAPPTSADKKPGNASPGPARIFQPVSATSQFFINVADNPRLDPRGQQGFGYAVFGKVTQGMEVIDRIVTAPTATKGRFNDVPQEDIAVLSAKRQNAAQSAQAQDRFVPGVHYTLLRTPVPTRDRGKVEVVEAFSYGCPPCYHLEPSLSEWRNGQTENVDFWRFPAVWNEPMKLYARAFYASRELAVSEKVHMPLFTAIVAEQKRLSNESELADFFAAQGVDKASFSQAFNSPAVEKQIKQSEAWVRSYNVGGAPEIIVNGKYRVDRARAGGLAEMLVVVDFLVQKEREGL